MTFLADQTFFLGGEYSSKKVFQRGADAGVGQLPYSVSAITTSDLSHSPSSQDDENPAPVSITAFIFGALVNILRC
jgi:hypothetical protein